MVIIKLDEKPARYIFKVMVPTDKDRTINQCVEVIAHWYEVHGDILMLFNSFNSDGRAAIASFAGGCWNSISRGSEIEG